MRQGRPAPLWDIYMCTEYFFYRHTERDSFIAKTACIRRDRGLLVASRGNFSDNGCVISCVPGCLGSEYKLRPAVAFQVDFVVVQDFPRFRFQKVFADKMERWCCTKKCKCYITCNESPEIFSGGM